MPTNDSDYVSLLEPIWTELWLGHDASERQANNFEAYKPYFDLLADDVVFKVEGPEELGIPGFPCEIKGKDKVLESYMSDDPGLFEPAIFDRPMEFLGSGNRVVVLGAESYRIRKNGVLARNKEFAHVIDFRDGRIVRVQQIADMSEYAIAQYCD